jgi:flavin-dependent dehydrogenase
MQRYDVAVIGAGLSGLQCARLMARRGLRVLLVDRKPSMDHAVHTTGIFVRRTLEDFDMPESCLGPPVRHVRLYSPARRPLDLESRHDEFRVGRMAKLYQFYLDDCLNAGVIWSPATRYAGSEPFKGRSVIRLEAKRYVRWAETRFIVGADGAQSRVARDLGLDVNHECIVGVEDVLEHVTLAGPPRFHCFLDPVLSPGYLAWVVHDGIEAHIGVGGYAGRFDPVRALDTFRASLTDLFDLSKAKRIERRGGRIPVNGVLRRIVNPRGLLTGDAAGAVSPLTAGGLDPCMRLSHLAADVIADYLATGDAKALLSYSGERFQSRFVTRRWMRRAVAGIRQPLLLELACGLLRQPVFKSLAWHVFFGRGSFPDAPAQWAKQPRLGRASAT